MYYPCSEQQRCWSDCMDAQADLRLCCSHMVSSPWIGDHHALQLHSGFCRELPHCYMVFVGNVQKSPIASHHKGLDPLSCFAVNVQLSQAQRKVDKISVRISLTLEASEIFSFLPYDLQSRKSCCCLGYPGKNLAFWSWDDCSKILEVLYCF